MMASRPDDFVQLSPSRMENRTFFSTIVHLIFVSSSASNIDLFIFFISLDMVDLPPKLYKNFKIVENWFFS